MKKLTVILKENNDIEFRGFKNENRPLTKEEAAKLMLWFYNKCKRVIEQSE